ncbi:MAG: hypothetical protein ACREF4_02445 [Gammaproteobacteria bacterium]
MINIERYASVFLSFALAALVISLVAWAVSTTPSRWAVFDQLHVQWDIMTETVEVSVILDKRAECRRVIVNKAMQPLIHNDLMPESQIPLNGKLPEKIQRAPIGVITLFDRSKPRAPVKPGQYLVTMQALCEVDPPKSDPPPDGRLVLRPPLAEPTTVAPTPELLAAEPVQSLIVVPRIAVRILPKQAPYRQPMFLH